MKLEVGMYVRHKPLLSRKYVKINKIKEIEEKENCLHIWLEDKDLITEKYLIKASYNIIDLIEVGDYLNGFKVSEIERYDTNTIIKIGNSTFNVLEGEKIYTPSYDNNNGYEKIEKLKSIVIKEQFESIKYSLEE